MLKRIFSALILPLLFLGGCSQDAPEAPETGTIIASVDDHAISETSFQRAYLPLLLYGDKFDSPENRLDMINFLIGQKILADEARDLDLDTVGLVKRSTQRVERRALARQLYQSWVRDQLEQPSEAEIRAGFQRGKKSIFMRHLFADNESDIREYHARLMREDEDFYTLSQDVFTDTLLSRNGGALGWVTFGDLDETLEDTLYQLKPGQFSQPVKSQYGWHILSMDDSQEEVFVTEEDFEKNRDLIRKKIIERREHVLGKQVLNDFMKDVDIEFDRDVTRQVWPIVVAHLNPQNIEKGLSPEFSTLEKQLYPLRNLVLLKADGESWTVSQILARLPELERSLLYGNLYVAASNIIRDEMLYREAKQLGFDSHPAVLEEVLDHEDQMLADTYVLQIADTLQFTDSQRQTYFQSNQLTKYHAPDSLHIELYQFADSLTAARALYQLRNGLITTDPGDETYWIGAGQSGDRIYQIARSIKVGTMAGPILNKGHWVLIKLLARKRYPLSYDLIKERVLADMEKERFNTTRNVLLETMRPEHQIVIDKKTLNR